VPVAEGNNEGVGADLTELMAAADALTGSGRALSAGAGGVDRQVPPLPDDDHGLVLAIVALDEAREGFDRRLGERFESMGRELADQAVTTAGADRFVALPAAAR
jgi:hypothetical protein